VKGAWQNAATIYVAREPAESELRLTLDQIPRIWRNGLAYTAEGSTAKIAFGPHGLGGPMLVVHVHVRVRPEFVERKRQ
jgi:hypothetical protein